MHIGERTGSRGLLTEEDRWKKKLSLIGKGGKRKKQGLKKRGRRKKRELGWHECRGKRRIGRGGKSKVVKNKLEGLN